MSNSSRNNPSSTKKPDNESSTSREEEDKPRSPSPVSRNLHVTSFYENKDKNPLFLVDLADSLKKTKTKNPEKQSEISVLIQKLSDIPNEMHHEEYKEKLIAEFMMTFTKVYIKEMGSKTALNSHFMGKDTLKVLWEAVLDFDKKEGSSGIMI